MLGNWKNFLTAKLASINSFHMGYYPSDKAQYVYFVEGSETGYIKIGITGDLSTRLSQLSNQTGQDIQFLAAFKGTATDEREIHEKFAALRVRGEWFRSTEELREFIQNVKDGSVSSNDFEVHRDEAVLTVREAIQALREYGANDSYLRKWSKDGFIKVLKTAGGHNRYLASDIRRIELEFGRRLDKRAFRKLTLADVAIYLNISVDRLESILESLDLAKMMVFDWETVFLIKSTLSEDGIAFPQEK